MKILIIQEVDWLKKVTYEPHHLSELFSLRGHEVFVMDVPEADIKNIFHGLHTTKIPRFHRVYDGASVTIIRPPSLLVKGLNRITYFLTCKRIIKKTVIENKIDVIMTYSTATSGIQTIEIAKELNVPVIFRELDVAHGLVRERLLRPLAKKCEKLVLDKATKIMPCTPELGRYAIEMGAKEEKVEYFPLGINIRDFKPMKKDLQLAQNLGINEKDRVIVFVGTIFDFAGLDKIISKFEILKNKLKTVKFLIVGGGPYFSQLKSLVSEKKLESDVILIGFKPQKELPKYISLADICVNPFIINDVTDRIIPTKILEYFACAKPVLSTPLKGTKELLPTEDFGIFYETSDNFVETLSNLLTDTTKLYEMGKRGYSYVKEYHNWDVLADKMLTKFEDLITIKNAS